MHWKNFVAREASLAVVDLNEALNDAPWSYRFGRFEWVAQRFRLLAGAELLLDETVEGFHCYLHLAVQATVEFLEHAPLGEAVASRTPAFFDAAVVDDTAAMQVIAALAPRERHPWREYEEDFLYTRITMDLLGQDWTAGEVEPMRARLAQVDPDSPRLALVDAFLARDAGGLAGALERICQRHAKKNEFEQGFGMTASSSAQILGRLPPLEAVAWFKRAQAAGIALPGICGIEGAVRLPCTQPPPAPGAWREFEKPERPRPPRRPADQPALPEVIVCGICSSRCEEEPAEAESWSYWCPHGQCRIDHAVGGFPRDLPDELEEALEEGRPVAAEWTGEVSFRFSSSFRGLQPTSVLGNSGGYLLCDPQVRAIVQAHCGDACEYLPVNVLDHKGRRVPADYVLVHPLGVHRCPWVPDDDDDDDAGDDAELVESDSPQAQAWLDGLPALSRVKQLHQRYFVAPALARALRQAPGISNLFLQRARF